MDVVADDTRSLKRRVGVGDRDRLDAYFTSVRDLEKRLASSEAWVNKPKPSVDFKAMDIANPNDFIARQRLMSDMIRLALSTDSSRFVVYRLVVDQALFHSTARQGVSHLAITGETRNCLSWQSLKKQSLIHGVIFYDRLKKLMSGESVLDTTSVLLTSNLEMLQVTRTRTCRCCRWWFQHGQHLAFNQNKTTPFRISICRFCSRQVFRQSDLQRQPEQCLASSQRKLSLFFILCWSNNNVQTIHVS